jgi:hypothetical protein
MDLNMLEVTLADVLRVLFFLLAKISEKERCDRFFERFNTAVLP